MTEQEELFLHHANSIENLNNSWRILQEIKEGKVEAESKSEVAEL